MPPKQASKGQGRPKATTSSRSSKAQEPQSSNPFASSDDDAEPERSTIGTRDDAQMLDQQEDEPEKTIPKDLLTRVLHEFFSKEPTRISRDANAAVSKYMDVFVREAIARAAVEKDGGFLEVEDLEKISPQLLLDL